MQQSCGSASFFIQEGKSRAVQARNQPVNHAITVGAVMSIADGTTVGEAEAATCATLGG